jgi:hypothetical protein
MRILFPAIAGLVMGGLLGGLLVAVLCGIVVQALGVSDHEAGAAVVAYFRFIPAGIAVGAVLGAIFMAAGARPVAR